MGSSAPADLPRATIEGVRRMCSEVGPLSRAGSQGSEGGAHRPMRILEKGVYRGPHLYSATPMVRIQLDLGSLEAWPTNLLEGFTERLTAMLPGLGNHGCSY